MKKHGAIGELRFKPEHILPKSATEYFQQNVWLGVSFPGPADARAAKETVGLDKFMWGSDYPHDEGTYPFSREALRQVFSDWSPADMQRILTDNVAKLYDFDVAALKPLARPVRADAGRARAAVARAAREPERGAAARAGRRRPDVAEPAVTNRFASRFSISRSRSASSRSRSSASRRSRSAFFTRCSASHRRGGGRAPRERRSVISGGRAVARMVLVARSGGAARSSRSSPASSCPSAAGRAGTRRARRCRARISTRISQTPLGRFRHSAGVGRDDVEERPDPEGEEGQE